MDYVIDIQGFYDKDNCFVAKEVAVIVVNNQLNREQLKAIGHWIISPPYVFTDLPKNVRTKNNWATRHHHGLEWFEGDVGLRAIHAILREITRTAGNIYTRGREKADYLRNITAREIKNLEESTCPSFADLPSTGEVCLHHGLLKRPKLSCALNNAIKLKDWILCDVPPPIFSDRPLQDHLPESINLKNTRDCYSPVVASDEYDPDWPGLAGFKLDSVKERLSSRSDSKSVDETVGPCC